MSLEFLQLIVLGVFAFGATRGKEPTSCAFYITASENPAYRLIYHFLNVFECFFLSNGIVNRGRSFLRKLSFSRNQICPPAPHARQGSP